MASWTNQSTSSLLPGEPWTSAKALAAFENPEAIAEGASGAPRIDPINAMAHQGTAGAIGTYAFAVCTVGDTAFGSNRAGSNLLPTSAAYASTDPSSSGGSPDFMFDTGTALSGNWKCMGTFDTADPASGDQMFGATLWLRIS
jgi:hypothetical protein